MKQLLIDIAFSLYNSPRYRGIKEFFDSILNDSRNSYKKYLDLMMIFFIISSIIILIYEVQNPIPEWLAYYDIYFISFLFLIEYLLRFWVSNDIHKLIVDEYQKSQFIGKRFRLRGPLKKGIKEKLSYMITPGAIIDILAILPAYRPLRILRFFVLFRVFKLLRYTKSLNQFVDVLANKRFELLTLLFMLFFVVSASGVAIYVLEEKVNPDITTLFDALYWALVTISTVGYGDISPVTVEGRTVSMAVIVSGMVMFSFATSVIVSAFSEKLDKLKERKAFDRIDPRKPLTIICGYGELCKMFMEYNEEELENYIILEKDPQRVKEATENGYNAIREDATSQDALRKYNGSYDNMVVLALVSNDIENIYITLNARSLSRKITIISRTSDKRLLNKYKLAGANHVIVPDDVANVMLMMAISHPTIYKASHAILTGKHMAVIDEIAARAGDHFVGKHLDDIHFKEQKLLLVGIEQNRTREFLFNPQENILIEEGDVLLVMGTHLNLEYFKEIYKVGN